MTEERLEAQLVISQPHLPRSIRIIRKRVLRVRSIVASSNSFRDRQHGDESFEGKRGLVSEHAGCLLRSETSRSFLLGPSTPPPRPNHHLSKRYLGRHQFLSFPIYRCTCFIHPSLPGSVLLNLSHSSASYPLRLIVANRRRAPRHVRGAVLHLSYSPGAQQIKRAVFLLMTTKY